MPFVTKGIFLYPKMKKSFRDFRAMDVYNVVKIIELFFAYLELIIICTSGVIEMILSEKYVNKEGFIKTAQS